MDFKIIRGVKYVCQLDIFSLTKPAESFMLEHSQHESAKIMPVKFLHTS